MKTLTRNLRHAVRRMWRHPLYALTIVACLALGIGANTAIFSVINTLLLRPLPVGDAESLAVVLLLREEIDPLGVGLKDHETLSQEMRSFSGTGLSERLTFNLLGGDRPERVEAARIDDRYLPTLGVEPIHGRGFTPDEDSPGGPRVALLGHGLWQRRFGGDPGVVGRRLNLEEEVYTVVGVLPPGFDLPQGTELWVPMAADVDALPLDDQMVPNYLMVARMTDGASLEAANTEADALIARLAREYPQQRNGWGVTVIPLRQQLLGDFQGKIKAALYLLVAVVGLLLLIACANVASLLLVRSLERGQEVAVQTALGARSAHLMGQLLTESLVLALFGGVAGLLLAYWVTPGLMALSPVEAVALGDLFARPVLDARVLGFALGVSLLTAVLFGLVPALRVSLPGGLVSHLKEGGSRASASRGGRRLMAGLVVGEIAVAVILLIGAGLAAHGFQRLQQTELGFDPAGKLSLELPISRLKYPEHPQRVAYARELLERIENLPGVTSAEMTTNIPLEYNTYDAPFTPQGMVPSDDAEVPVTGHRLVSPGYLEQMGMTLLEGRTLTEEDRNPDLPAVVVTRELARRSWPGESALGKRLQLGYPPFEGFPPFTVVGVVADTKEDRFNFGIDRPAWYLSYFQTATGIPSIYLVVGTDGDPRRLIPAVRRIVWEVDSDQPIVNVKTVQEAVDSFLGPQRFSALLMGVFALLGLLLAAVGLYGLLSYWVTQSTREIGIRMAMGARSGDLMKLALGRGLRLTLLGLAVGLGGGWALARLLAGRIEQLQGGDLGTFLGIAAVLLLVALTATYLPARRTTRIDPIVALRYE